MKRLLQQATDDEFLTHCYQYFFSRQPDPEGREHHLRALAAGLRREDLIQSFVASEEFIGRFSNAHAWSVERLVDSAPKFVADGHFYSPIPASEDYKNYDASALGDISADLANEQKQLELAESFKTFYDELPFPADESDAYRYYLNNGAFNYFDGIILYCFIRWLKPRKIIEVGSGFSSAAMMDTCERFLQGSTDITFIEPYPATLYSRLLPEDKARYTIIEKKLQDVPLDIFRSLQKNDILFIDSSHVAKFGSDVNHLLFNILPILQEGVVLHFHDIFRNFDYPLEWLQEGRAWNEGYILRAFLSSNRNYRILFFNDWFAHRHWDYLERNMPLCTVQPKGSPFKNCGVSLWIEKTGQG